MANASRRRSTLEVLFDNNGFLLSVQSSLLWVQRVFGAFIESSTNFLRNRQILHTTTQNWPECCWGMTEVKGSGSSNELLPGWPKLINGKDESTVFNLINAYCWILRRRSRKSHHFTNLYYYYYYYIQYLPNSTYSSNWLICMWRPSWPCHRIGRRAWASLLDLYLHIHRPAFNVCVRHSVDTLLHFHLRYLADWLWSLLNILLLT